MPLILGANSVTGGYEVDNSLRFNSGSTEYLQRTPGSAGSLTTWTYSFWTKRSVLATAEQYLSAGPRGGGGNVEDQLYSISTDQINWYDGTAASNVLRTTQLFRDVSAWYHIMYVWDTTNATAGDRARIYVNGAEVTAFSVDNNPSLNAVSKINGTGQHRIGQVGTLPGENLNGYLAEVNFIDGQALDPDNFGEFDSATGIWKPIAYTGTYGTNGFFLEFKDSSALGDDTSGNGNDFTVNNLTSIDQTTDTPTNNFCTLNPLNPTTSVTFSNGNLTFTNTSSGHRMVAGTIGVSTGKWYAEVLVTSLGGTFPQIGIVDVTQWAQDSQPGANTRGWGYLSNGSVFNSNSSIDTGEASYTDADIISIAMDLDNNKLYFAKNGTYINSGVPTSGATGTGAYSITSGVTYVFSNSSLDSGTDPVYEWNFGNAPYTISSGNSDANGYGNFEYSVPSGYYALCTNNLAEYG
jgi:hypothetical protein